MIMILIETKKCRKPVRKLRKKAINVAENVRILIILQVTKMEDFSP